MALSSRVALASRATALAAAMDSGSCLVVVTPSKTSTVMGSCSALAAAAPSDTAAVTNTGYCPAVVTVVASSEISSTRSCFVFTY
jgi:hypothetical protein